jgi:predicted nucleotidyltransferase
MVVNCITLPDEWLADFCKRWKIAEFALFGSVVRDDFQPDSDIDVLVTYAPDSHTTLFDEVEIELELEAFLGRKVDVASRRGVEQSRNPIRRKAILDSARVIYAAS